MDTDSLLTHDPVLDTIALDAFVGVHNATAIHLGFANKVHFKVTRKPVSRITVGIRGATQRERVGVGVKVAVDEDIFFAEVQRLPRPFHLETTVFLEGGESIALMRIVTARIFFNISARSRA